MGALRRSSRALIGKGGLLADSLPVLAEFGGVYLAVTGGAAVLETTQTKAVEFEELMPECLWKFRVPDFGPLIIAVDAHGTSLYESIKAGASAKLEESAAQM